MDRTEAMIHQNLYCPNIIAVRKEVNNCDTDQCTKRSNKKYGKLPDKLNDEIPWNKLCIDPIGIYVIRRKERKKTYILMSLR